MDQTDDDKLREKEAAEFLRTYWRADFLKYTDLKVKPHDCEYRITTDHDGVEHHDWRLVEFKTRHVFTPIHTWSHFFVEKGKLDRCLDESELRGVPFWLGMLWWDRMGIMEITREMTIPWKTKETGRTDRGRQNDIEPHYYVPFTIVKFIAERHWGDYAEKR
jgi:hypothetical protein